MPEMKRVDGINAIFFNEQSLERHLEQHNDVIQCLKRNR